MSLWPHYVFGRRGIGLSTRYWLGRILRGRGHLEDLSIGVRVIKLILKKRGGLGAWTEVILLMIRRSYGMLCTRWWTFLFDKIRGISWKLRNCWIWKEDSAPRSEVLKHYCLIFAASVARFNTKYSAFCWHVLLTLSLRFPQQTTIISTAFTDCSF